MLAPTARSLFLRAPLVQARAPTALASIRALHSHGSLPASSLPKATAKRTVTTSAPTPLERNEPRRVDRVPWPPKLRASLSLPLPPSSSSRPSADSCTGDRQHSVEGPQVGVHRDRARLHLARRRELPLPPSPSFPSSPQLLTLSPSCAQVCFFGLVTIYYYHSTGKGVRPLLHRPAFPRASSPTDARPLSLARSLAVPRARQQPRGAALALLRRPQARRLSASVARVQRSPSRFSLPFLPTQSRPLASLSWVLLLVSCLLRSSTTVSLCVHTPERTVNRNSSSCPARASSPSRAAGALAALCLLLLLAHAIDVAREVCQSSLQQLAGSCDSSYELSSMLGRPLRPLRATRSADLLPRPHLADFWRRTRKVISEHSSEC